MQPGWIGVVWAAFAAALLGVLVVAVADGYSPPTGLLILLVALPTAITLAAPLVGHSRRNGVNTIQHREMPLGCERDNRVESSNNSAEGSHHRGPTARASRTRLDDVDWEVVSNICGALDSRQLAWLRSTEFITPWLDYHARPAMDIAPLVAEVVDAPFEDDIRDGLRILSDAIEAFVEFYAHNTFPDPLLLGEEWRFFEWDEPGVSEESNVGGELWGGKPARLHHLSTELAEAYQDFSAIAGRDPKVGRRIKQRV